MKPNFQLSIIAVFIFVSFSYSQNANQTLSNLSTPTAVNADLLPGITNAATLASGAYNYSLFVDGKLFGTKQMEHMK